MKKGNAKKCDDTDEHSSSFQIIWNWFDQIPRPQYSPNFRSKIKGVDSESFDFILYKAWGSFSCETNWKHKSTWGLNEYLEVNTLLATL